MSEIEWYFAYASLAMDMKEENRRTRDIIMSHASIVSPENAHEAMKSIELEDELTDEEEKQLKTRSRTLFEDKLHETDSDGRIKSDEVIGEMIRNRRSLPIESLSDMREKDG